MTDVPHRVRFWAGVGEVVDVVDDHSPDVTDPLDRMFVVAVDGLTYRVLESDASVVG